MPCGCERPRPAGERPLQLVELPVPQPGPGEVLIAVHACGVCHTDLHTVEGELEPHRSPVVPGHQIVGEVVALGEGADAVPAGGEPGGAPLRLGERVGVPWLWRACGTCRYCRRGDENLCENALFTGYDVDGGYAEYTVAPAAFAYRLPDMPDLAVAPLLCAGIIGYRCLRLTGVVGGAGAARRAARPAARPAAPPPRPLRLRRRRPHLPAGGRHWAGRCTCSRAARSIASLPAELGAVWAGAAGERPAARPGGASTPPCSTPPSSSPPPASSPSTPCGACDKGGIVALGGIYSSPIPPIDYPVIYHERVVRSVANSTRQDARELLRVAARSRCGPR